MGGHGGLNILPQKRWNVYNFDNRERVRRDEEAAAREEQVRQQKARQAELEFKLEKLREATQSKRRRIEKGESGAPQEEGAEGAIVLREASGSSGGRHGESDGAQRPQFINLFAEFEAREREGNGILQEREKGRKGEVREKQGTRGSRSERNEGKGIEKLDGKPTGEPADEHYALGHGAVDKNGRKPWYLMKSFVVDRARDEKEQRSSAKIQIAEKTVGLKRKTVEELRAERVKREQLEKTKVHKLVVANTGRSATGYEHLPNTRVPHYHGSFGNAR